MNSQTDLEQLLAAVALGDRSAFEALYRAAAPRLLTLMLRTLQNRSLAEDALQEAFVQVWYSAKDYHRDKGAPMAWLASIARYRAFDMLRRERSLNDRAAAAGRQAQIDAELDDEPLAGDSAQVSYELRLLSQCLHRLPEPQRRSLLLAYYYGHSHSEIADRQRLPIGTVKTWLRRGLVSVRECLGL